MTFLRRAGAGTDPAGDRVVWTMSEGRRGRRWREVRASAEGAVVSSLLLETDPDGRFLHTELSTAAGLLTLHPEPDGTLHGNVVEGSRVRHVVGLGWDPEAVLLLEGSSISVAAVAHLVGVGGLAGRERWPAVLVGLDLAIGVREVAVEQPAGTSWRFGEGVVVELDADGLPRFVDGGTWPLEVE